MLFASHEARALVCGKKMGPFFAVNLFLVNFSARSIKRSIVNFDTWQLVKLLKIWNCKSVPLRYMDKVRNTIRNIPGWIHSGLELLSKFCLNVQIQIVFFGNPVSLLYIIEWPQNQG